MKQQAYTFDKVRLFIKSVGLTFMCAGDGPAVQPAGNNARPCSRLVRLTGWHSPLPDGIFRDLSIPCKVINEGSLSCAG